MTISNLPKTERPLTAQETLFVAEFVSSNNMLASYKRAYSANGKTDRAMDLNARKLLKRPHVARAVEAGRQVLGQKLVFDIKDVMMEWLDIATADPNELQSIERRCCRYCHGRGHRYQWTAREFSDALLDVMEHNAKVGEASKDAKRLPDPAGGDDFNFTLAPHPECPECRGEGEVAVIVKDTTKLTGKARKLFGGVKWTKYGPEILYRDQDAALANIAKALGMFAEIVRLEHNLHQKANAPMPTDPVAAAQAYQDLIAGEG